MHIKLGPLLEVGKKKKRMLVKQVETLEEFAWVLDNSKVVYVTVWDRLHPTSFFQNWTIRTIRKFIGRGYFWIVSTYQI